MHLILVLSSCLTICSINIAFHTNQVVMGNLLLLLLVSSVYRHTTSAMFLDGHQYLQYNLSYVVDLSVVHFIGIVDFVYILIHLDLRRFFTFFLFLTVPLVYYKFLSGKPYKIYHFLSHAFFIHYLGNIATMIMLVPELEYLSYY